MISNALQNIIIIIIGLCMFAIPNKNSVILFPEKTKPITKTKVLKFRVLKNWKKSTKTNTYLLCFTGNLFRSS